MTRRIVIAGNWKLNKTSDSARELALALRNGLEANPTQAEVIIAPVFTVLSGVSEVVKDCPIGLSGQNVYWEDNGAFTGEISAAMLRDVGCTHVIIGHSERRQYFGETNETVRKKIESSYGAGLIPIICVGETLAQREAGQTQDIVLEQVSRALEGLTEAQVKTSIIAYEPVWAIGTGLTAKPEDAQEVHAAIRGRVESLFNSAIAATLRILYGGSVKPHNASELLAQTDIDGALVGGASLKAQSFLDIIAASA